MAAHEDDSVFKRVREHTLYEWMLSIKTNKRVVEVACGRNSAWWLSVHCKLVAVVKLIACHIDGVHCLQRGSQITSREALAYIVATKQNPKTAIIQLTCNTRKQHKGHVHFSGHPCYHTCVIAPQYQQ